MIDSNSFNILKLLKADPSYRALIDKTLSGEGKSIFGLKGALSSIFAADCFLQKKAKSSFIYASVDTNIDASVNASTSINEFSINPTNPLSKKTSKNRSSDKDALGALNITNGFPCVVCVVANIQDALALKADIQSAIFDEAAVPIDILDGWGSLPYTPLSTGLSIFGERVAALLALSKAGIHIVTLRALLTPCVPKKYLESLCFELCVGSKVDPTALGEKLAFLGYFRVPRVTGRCEYSIRGEVIDIFPAAATKALRATLDFDTIESLKEFDSETQSTTKKLDKALIIPTKEVIWTDELITTLSALFEELQKNGGVSKDDFFLTEKKAEGTGEDEKAGFSNKGKGDFFEADKTLGVSDNFDGGATLFSKKGEGEEKGVFGGDKTLGKEGEGAFLGDLKAGAKKSGDPIQKNGGAQLDFDFDDENGKKLSAQCAQIIEHLIDTKAASGEEQFYGALWGGVHDISEYFEKGCTTLFFGYERLLTEADNIGREVLGMYQRTHSTFPAISPTRYTAKFSVIEQKLPNVVKLLLFNGLGDGAEGNKSENFSEDLNANLNANLKDNLGDSSIGHSSSNKNLNSSISDNLEDNVSSGFSGANNVSGNLGGSFSDSGTLCAEGALKGDFTDNKDLGGALNANLKDKLRDSSIGHSSSNKSLNNTLSGELGDGEVFNLADNPIKEKNSKTTSTFESGGKKAFENDTLQFESTLGTSFFGNVNLLREELGTLQSEGWTVIIYGNNPNQALRLKELLKEFTQSEEAKVKVFGRVISAGFSVPKIKLRVISENEIFGRRKSQTAALKRTGNLEKESKALATSPIDTFVDLNEGDFVVHVKYGIGVFKGIERVKTAATERDYIKLEYAGGDNLFVPIEQVNLIQRYIGREGSVIKLDKIGGSAWEARKAKVRKEVEDLAKHLIALYAKRQASRGFACAQDDEWSLMFEASFPYEDTADQTTATAEIKRDMESIIPMDRLLCGDVGFGKTEVAMRASFKAVMNGRQVAFLCPTTILVEQHYETFIKRFKGFPVTIKKLSRFVAAADIRKTLAEVKEGNVDIVIGTHRLIQKDVLFKSLGLLVIDEEQRFGVKDKEKLKTFKANIDCLALSATPIPRTLHMSILKIRDMSLLTTPPQNRQPIATHVGTWSDEVVVRAVRLECARGGQVFFLHNKIETLEDTRYKLSQLLPELSIEVAHGQMEGEELDEIFHRFKMRAFQVLIATTIIENGIDIPNVNTIIIDRADMYGVSQLYQLRGRVGRSDRQAYAYLLYNRDKNLSEVAMKRLQAISDFTELGSGFKIAMKDMEIRGAGNLLGRDQSGAFYSVGFDMYVRLLDEAVRELLAQNEGALVSDEDAALELEYTGFIPDTYVSTPQIKMEIYKKVSAITDDSLLNRLIHELNDRFGPIPEEVSALLSISQIKILCKTLHIASIKERAGVASVEFSRVKDINVQKVVTLIKSSAGLVRLNPAKPNFILLTTKGVALKDKAAFIKEYLEAIV